MVKSLKSTSRTAELYFLTSGTNANGERYTELLKDKLQTDVGASPCNRGNEFMRHSDITLAAKQIETAK